MAGAECLVARRGLKRHSLACSTLSMADLNYGRPPGSGMHMEDTGMDPRGKKVEIKPFPKIKTELKAKLGFKKYKTLFCSLLIDI